MMLADVNVLVCAFREDTADHLPSRRWLDAVVKDAPPLGISPQVLSSVVRVATHRKVFKPQSILAEVLAYCDNLLNQPHARIIVPGDGHWAIFRRLCIEADARENLVPDAWFAALAIEHGCEWVTLDRDYARFPGLKWRTPDAV